MIYYDPVQGDVLTRQIAYRPKTCFVMTQMGKPVPKEIRNMRRTLEKYLKKEDYTLIDANTLIRGKDFLLKIWEMILAVPLGIVLISKDLPPYTLANIFYEIGLMQAYGHETLIVKPATAMYPRILLEPNILNMTDPLERKYQHFLEASKIKRNIMPQLPNYWKRIHCFQ